MRRFASNSITIAVSAFLVVGMLAVASAQSEEEAWVTFNDQVSDGTWVEVAEANLPEGGFIAIRDENGLIPDNLFGNETDYLGHSEYLEPGTHMAIIVWLEEHDLEGEQTLTAVLYHDDGNRTFDPEANERYSRDGEDVMDSATVTFEEEVAGPGDSPSPAPGDDDQEGAPAPGIIAVLAIVGLAFLAARRR